MNNFETFQALFELNKSLKGTSLQVPYVFLDKECVYCFFDFGLLMIKHEFQLSDETSVIAFAISKLDLLERVFNKSDDSEVKAVDFKQLKSKIRLVNNGIKYEIALANVTDQLIQYYTKLSDYRKVYGNDCTFHDFNSELFFDVIRQISVKNELLQIHDVEFDRHGTLEFSDGMLIRSSCENLVPFSFKMKHSLVEKLAVITSIFTRVGINKLFNDDAITFSNDDNSLLYIARAFTEHMSNDTVIKDVALQLSDDTMFSKNIPDLASLIEISQSVSLIAGNNSAEFGSESVYKDFIQLVVKSNQMFIKTLDKENSSAETLEPVTIETTKFNVPDGKYNLTYYYLSKVKDKIKASNSEAMLNPVLNYGGRLSDSDNFIFWIKTTFDNFTCNYLLTGRSVFSKEQ